MGRATEREGGRGGATGAVCPGPHLVRGPRDPIATLSIKDRDTLIVQSPYNIALAIREVFS